MGQSPTSSLTASSIKYVQTTDDEHFGKIEIFEPNENPSQYIMKYRTICESKQQLAQSLAFHQLFQKLKHRVLAKLYFLQPLTYKLCSEVFQLNRYYSYYNITIHQIFHKRVLSESLFLESQLWYMVTSLLEVGEYLQGQGLAVEGYDMKRVFVTPGGFVKIYTAEIEKDHLHSNYYKVLNSISGLDSNQNILSPEQIQQLKQRETRVQYNVYKADVFSIGVILLQLMTLNQRGFYDSVSGDINVEKIRYLLSELMTNRVYSHSLVEYITRLVEVDEESRWDFVEAVEQLKRLKNREQGIELVKSIGADISIKRKTPNITPVLGEVNVIEKLVAAPISSMAFKRKGTQSMAVTGKSLLSNKEN